MITIDGSRGALGGQGLRTSLALAMALYAAFCMVNIRAHRAKPGMRSTPRAVRLRRGISSRWPVARIAGTGGASFTVHIITDHSVTYQETIVDFMECRTDMRLWARAMLM